MTSAAKNPFADLIPKTYPSGRPIPEAARLRLIQAADPTFVPNRGIPLKKKLRVRHLYVTEGHDYSAIADDTGLTIGQIKHMIDKNAQWTIERIEIEKALLSTEVSREQELKQLNDEVVQEIGSKSAELVIGTLDMAKSKLDASDAQGLNYAASAAKSFEAMFRKARGLDDGPASGSPAASAVNLFFLAAPQRDEPKPVTPTPPEPIEVPPPDQAEGF